MSNVVQREAFEKVTNEQFQKLTPSDPTPPTETIDHTTELSDNIGSLYLNPECSDVTFIVEGEKIYAHRVILAARSEYFRALLCGGMRETDEKEIVFHDTTVDAFKLLLKYVYTGIMPIGNLKEDMVLEVLEFAHRYVFTNLQVAISDYLKTIINNLNYSSFLNAAIMYCMDDLIEYCLQYGDQNCSELLHSQQFLELSGDALEKLVSRHSFYAPELEIFEGISKWIEASPERKDNHPKMTSLVRLALIPKISLLDTIRPSGFVSPDDVLDAIALQCNLNNCINTTAQVVPRGVLRANVNVASASLGAKVLSGQVKGSLLNEEMQMAEDDTQLTRHKIDDSVGIIVGLSMPHIINTIRLYLPDQEQRMYSYRLYVGMFLNKEDVFDPLLTTDLEWIPISDYSRFLCRSVQTITFQSRAVKYIRVVGVRNCTLYSKFHLAAIEAVYMPVSLFSGTVNGVPIPFDNIATVEKHATVIEGVSRSRNALLNGQTSDYDWDNGYTCHQIGSGSITVQFPQPYIISSMRMLLWDLDDRYYSYYVEVSNDQENWRKVADRTRWQCRSWQLITFEPQSVVFVRIVGTRNSANEVFHLVHLECPAREDAPPPPENSAIPPMDCIGQIPRD